MPAVLLSLTAIPAVMQLDQKQLRAVAAAAVVLHPIWGAAGLLRDSESSVLPSWTSSPVGAESCTEDWQAQQCTSVCHLVPDATQAGWRLGLYQQHGVDAPAGEGRKYVTNRLTHRE